MFDLICFLIVWEMRAAGSFRIKTWSREMQRTKEIYRSLFPSSSDATRCLGRWGRGARGRGWERGRVSCRVDEHFSHFFFISRRIVFKKGFVIIASLPLIMLTWTMSRDVTETKKALWSIILCIHILRVDRHGNLYFHAFILLINAQCI